MRHWRLDDLVSAQSNNIKLVEALKLIQSWPTLKSLAAYDNSNYAELYQFRKVFFQEVDDTIVVVNHFLAKCLCHVKVRLLYLIIFIKS